MSAIAGTHAAPGCAVRVDGVTKSFGSRAVLDNITLDIPPGEIVGLVGRSGVGKSTLLRVISGLLNIDSGEVMIGDEPAGVARSRKHVGFMPQSPALMPWRSVVDNVAIVRRLNARAPSADVAVDDVLASVGMLEQRDRYPAELSGGMQLRVALARALAVGAPLLTLDEPFAALDEVTRSAMYDLVADVWRRNRQTIVLVTHNLDEAVLLCDRVVVLSGTPATVRASVDVDGARPRRAALDSGRYGDVLAALRAALEQQ